MNKYKIDYHNGEDKESAKVNGDNEAMAVSNLRKRIVTRLIKMGVSKSVAKEEAEYLTVLEIKKI